MGRLGGTWSEGLLLLTVGVEDTRFFPELEVQSRVGLGGSVGAEGGISESGEMPGEWHICSCRRREFYCEECRGGLGARRSGLVPSLGVLLTSFAHWAMWLGCLGYRPEFSGVMWMPGENSGLSNSVMVQHIFRLLHNLVVGA